MHLFGVHTVFRQVFDLDVFEVADTAVQGQLLPDDVVYLETFHHLTADVEPCDGGSDGALDFGVYGLIALGIPVLDVAHALQLVGQWGVTQAADVLVELLVGAVEEETHGAAARGGVVNHLCHQRLVGTEVELVADAYLAGRVDNDVPQAHVLVQFTLQEHGDFGTGLLLLAIQQGREHLGVVGHHHIALVQVVKQVFEQTVLDGLGVAVQHHEACLVALL